MFHHVRPAPNEAFQPNNLLEITPDFLDEVLRLLRRLDYDIVSLAEAVRRMRAADHRRRFAVLTFDDGYRDNALHAAPILARHQAPYTVFVTPGFAERTARLWWVELEVAIRRSQRIELKIGGDMLRLPCTSIAEKRLAWTAIYSRLRLGSEDQLGSAMDRLCDRAGIDRPGLVASLCLDWPEMRRLAADPLADFGAHTLTHPRLAKLPEAAQRREVETSRSVIEAELGRPVRHLAYPIGDRTSAGPREFATAQDLGFDAAVTTRPGVLFAEHAHHLTALPRLSINGLWQRSRHVEVLLSGAAYALWNRGRRVDAA